MTRRPLPAWPRFVALTVLGAALTAADHQAAIDARAQQCAEQGIATLKGSNPGIPWLALWHLRRGEKEQGLKVLYKLLDDTKPESQGHPFLSYVLAHIWLHYGKLYDAPHAAKWLELARTRGAYSYNLVPFPSNYATTNLRMTGSATWYLNSVGLGLDKMPAAIIPKEDPTRVEYLRDAITRIGRTGMPEFASRPYGVYNMVPLMCLAEQTADQDLAQRAGVVYEAFLACAAATWLQGHWVAATGRSYGDLLSQGTNSSINFLWTYFGGLPNDGRGPGLAAGAMAYRPPNYVVDVATRRDEPYVATSRVSWVKEGDPGIVLNPTGFLQYSYLNRSYGVYSQITEPNTRLQEQQIFPPGVMWLDPTGNTSCLWVTVPASARAHTHGSPELGQEWVQHEGALLLVAKPLAGETSPLLKGLVPGNKEALIDDAAKDGRIYLAYPGVLIALTAAKPFTWDPKEVYDLRDQPKPRKATDTRPADGCFRITDGPLVMAYDTLRPDQAQGATPAERLAWFRDQIRTKTKLTASEGSGTYQALNGHALQRTVGQRAHVDGQPVDIQGRPFLANPWMDQPYQPDPKAPCTLTVSIDGKTHLYDLQNYRISHHDGPARPTHLTASAASRKVSLRWTPGPGQPTGYVVRRATGDGAATDVATVTTATWDDTTVQDGTAYRYEVAARNAGGTSPAGVPVTVTPGAHVPAQPTGLATTVSDGRVDLAWQAVPGATGYTVGRAVTPGGPYQTIATVTGTTATDTTATNHRTWWYVVSATANGSTGGTSAEAAALPCAPLLPAPAGVQVTRTTQTVDGKSLPGMRITWKAVPGAQHYNLKLSRTLRSLYIIRGSVTEPSWFISDDLALSQGLFLRITAVNATGEGEPCEGFELPAVKPPKPGEAAKTED